MAAHTKIQWAEASWNVVIGCDKVSPGCDRCYAIRTAHRMAANPNPKVAEVYAGVEADGEWTGRLNVVESRLDLPLRWRLPRRIFVNAQSDLFHSGLADKLLAEVVATAAISQRHTFLVLTKRPGRMRHLLSSDRFVDEVGRAAERLWERPGWHHSADAQWPGWPLPNLHPGVSVEDQHWADVRIPVLLDTPAAVRWVSAEPLLGPVDFTDWLGGTEGTASISWLVVGGESGPGARPMHPQWARDIRDQCAAAGVPYFFKQAGEVLARQWGCRDRKGGDPTEWPEPFPREYPG